jgi:hypothetical protein
LLFSGGAPCSNEMSEEPQPQSSLPAQPKRFSPRRRGHRGGRGRRRPAPSAPVAEPPAENAVSASAVSMSTETAEEKSQPPPREAEFNESAISRAVEEVTQIAESLKQTLAQMEEVLELVELAERQKLGDEREIDSLRRALRKIQYPRDEH